MKTMFRQLLLTLLFPLAAVNTHVRMSATDLRCEYQRDPVAVDAAAPRLSWVLESGARGERQTAYRILVASSAEKLQRDQGDLWDSGKVVSSKQNQIAYAGEPLAANTECFWKVQVWDQGGKASKWSPPARWGMGLLKPADQPLPKGSGAAGWQAKWIGYHPQAAAPVEGCSWVWFPEGNPAQTAPAVKRYFRKLMSLPAGAQVRSATLFATADNRMTVSVNAGQANG